MSAQFNCNVMIVNNSNQTLTLNTFGLNPKSGNYSPAPPNTIDVGQTVNFQLSGETSGSCEYYFYDDGGNMKKLFFSYQCPHSPPPLGGNSANGFINGTGVQIQMIPNPLPQAGHPLNVQFILSPTS